MGTYIYKNKFVCMQKSFTHVEEMISDELFLSWFYKENQEKSSAWEKWMSENPGYSPMVSEAVKLMGELYAAEAGVPSSKVDAAYNRLNEKLAELNDDMAPVVTMRPARKRWWMVAAAAVLLVAAGLTFYNYSSPKSVIETQYGQTSSRLLPDGSQVMLNANTIVTLCSEWTETNDREVWLKGEAFFQVKKTEKKNRFIVHTDQLDVIVTGTQFNVRTGNGKTSVLLTEGSVTIRTADGKEVKMVPGDFVEINNNIPEKRSTNIETVLAWKENKLNFDNTPMKDVAVMINNHYGVAVNLADESVANMKITGMMPNNNLDDLLKALEATSDFRITRSEKTIIIAKQ
jgi:ferric-dicitrate binding protein FerR (iron transport regulator)